MLLFASLYPKQISNKHKFWYLKRRNLCCSRTAQVADVVESAQRCNMVHA